MPMILPMLYITALIQLSCTRDIEANKISFHCRLRSVYLFVYNAIHESMTLKSLFICMRIQHAFIEKQWAPTCDNASPDGRTM